MDTRTIEDEHLQRGLEKGISGDREAYRDFLTQVYDMVLPVVKRKCPSTWDDVAQEILISVHDARHTYDSSRPIRPWINAIVYFRINDSRRAYWRGEKRIEAYKHANERTELSHVADYSNLSEAVGALPVNQREVVTLMKIEGYSVKEVSTKLGITVAAVKNRAARAYEALRILLTEEGT